MTCSAPSTGIRVVGPNTSGVLNVHTGANLVGVPDVPPGPISLVTQSGNMLLSLLADLRALDAEGLDGDCACQNTIQARDQQTGDGPQHRQRPGMVSAQ